MIASRSSVLCVELSLLVEAVGPEGRLFVVFMEISFQSALNLRSVKSGKDFPPWWSSCGRTCL